MRGGSSNRKAPVRAKILDPPLPAWCLPWYVVYAGPSGCDNQINVIHSVEGHGGKDVCQTPNNPCLTYTGGL